MCERCRAGLRRAPAIRSIEGVDVASAYVHETVAQRLVHRLKYHGIEAAATVLAAEMARRVPAEATALVPVPRARLRTVKYGIDPAAALARRIGAAIGLPVIEALQPTLWWPAHAGSSRSGRRAPRFVLRKSPPSSGVLIDDVLTTGATLAAAARTAQLRFAVTATRAGCDRSG